jgi:hypothetical protein
MVAYGLDWVFCLARLDWRFLFSPAEVTNVPSAKVVFPLEQLAANIAKANSLSLLDLSSPP